MWLLFDTDFLLLFLLSLFVLVGIEFIFQSLSWKRFNVDVISGRLSLVSLVCLWTSKQKDGCIVASSLTLHSGQSYPGTPEQPGSRTGTHPG